MTEQEKKYYTYIVECSDGSLYTGYTNDLKKRLAAHNAGRGGKYTKSRTPCKLVHQEVFDDKVLAQRREYFIKHNLTRKDKLKLIREGLKKSYVSKNAGADLVEYLRVIGRDVEFTESSGIVDDPISCHPDIFMCKLGMDEGEIVYAKSEALGKEYPMDVKYNAACTGKFFLHNLKYTAPELLEKARNRGFTMVNVKQGYSKCSTVIVDENSIITYDRGITQAARDAGISVLLVSPEGVILPGYDRGFIGGASGRVGKEIIFNGDLSKHEDYRQIKKFIEERNLKCRFFKGYALTDIGSIL